MVLRKKDKFTYEEIMTAISKMDKVLGQGVLLMGYPTIEKAVNDLKSGELIKLLRNCDEQANFYMGLKASLVEFYKILNGEDTEIPTEKDLTDEERE